jgi:hypothetical protein
MILACQKFLRNFHRMLSPSVAESRYFVKNCYTSLSNWPNRLSNIAKLPLIGGEKLRFVNYCYWLLVINCWLLVINYWLLVMGCWVEILWLLAGKKGNIEQRISKNI